LYFYRTLRRLSGLFILALEWLVLGLRPSLSKVTSLSVILLGAIIAGAGDLAFDFASYSFVMINNLFTAGYLIAIKKLDNGEPKLTSFGKVYYNSLISIPWLLIIAFLNGEMASISKYEYLGDFGFQVGFLFSCFLAFGVNAATFWCTTATNALTTSVTGQCKNILTTVLGMFLFGDVKPTGLLVSGLSVGIGGSLWFSYVETTKDQKSPPPKVTIKRNEADLEMPEREPLKNGAHDRNE
jgi:drug/metabolite transporter (DMT)-like permease